MSNTQVINLPSSSPSDPLTFTADDGSTATPASDNINNLSSSTSTNNDDGIQTRNTGDTTETQLTNRLIDSVTSINGSTEDLITFDLGVNPAVYRFKFDICGRDTGTGDGVGYTVFASAKTDGASATIIATPFVDNDEDTSLLDASTNVIASGNNIILQVTGVLLQTISYKSLGSYVRV